MLGDNVQYWLKGIYIKVQLKSDKEIMLKKGVYTDKELNSLIGLELKSQMVSHDDILRENNLGKVTKMVISLDELDNLDNLKDRKPSNTVFTYNVFSPEYFTCFEPKTPQYKKLKNDKIVFLTLRIMDQNNKVITNGLGQL